MIRDAGYRQEVAGRLRVACPGATIREIAEATGFHPETVRRIVRGNAPITAEFVAAAGRRLGVSPNWLVLGQGPMRMGKSKGRELNPATVRAQLLTAIDRCLGEGVQQRGPVAAPAVHEPPGPSTFRGRTRKAAGAP